MSQEFRDYLKPSQVLSYLLYEHVDLPSIFTLLQGLFDVTISGANEQGYRSCRCNEEICCNSPVLHRVFSQVRTSVCKCLAWLEYKTWIHERWNDVLNISFHSLCVLANDGDAICRSLAAHLSIVKHCLSRSADQSVLSTTRNRTPPAFCIWSSELAKRLVSCIDRIG
jgi:hypothetical protein